MAETIEKTSETVEVSDNSGAAESGAQVTRAQAREAGWSEKEMDSAEKHGLIKKEEKPAVPGKESEKPEPAAAAEPEPEKGAAEPEAAAAEELEKKPEPAKGVGVASDFDLTPELQAKFEEIFGKGTMPRGLFARLKSERRARQRLEEELRAMRGGKAPAPKAAEPEPGDDEELDRPLTPRMLQEMEKRKAKEAEEQKQLMAEHQQAVNSAQIEQESYAKETLPDYDEASELAKDVMRNLDKLFTEPRIKQRALRLMQEFQVAAHRANEFELEDRHAAFVIYELGQMHPNYGKKPAPAGDPPEKTGPSKDPKAPGSLKPETLKRIEQNTQRRASSASVPGGAGKRVVSADDVTLADLNAMDFQKRKAFREKHPAQYAKLTRG